MMRLPTLPTILSIVICGGLLLSPLNEIRKSSASDATPSPSSDDPATWPIINEINAKNLQPFGIFGHGHNTQALWAGHTIIVGGDRGVWLYDTQKPDDPPRQLDEPDLPVYSMALSHDKKLFAVSAGVKASGLGEGGSIRVWDVATGTLQLIISTETIPISFSPDDRFIIGYGFRPRAFFPMEVDAWDIQSGVNVAFLWSFRAFSQNFKDTIRIGQKLELIAQISPDGIISVWTTSHYVVQGSNESQHLIDIPAASGVTFQRENSILAVNQSGHWLKIIDPHARRFLDVIDISSPIEPDPTLSPDGKTRVVIEDGAVVLRDVGTDNLVKVLRGRQVTDAAFSYDNRSLALVNGDAYVDVYDLASQQIRMTLAGHSAPITRVVFSPDGRWIATASHDQTVRLWAATTGQQQRIWSPGEDPTAIAFSPDSQILAAIDENFNLRLWNVKTGQLWAKLAGPEDGTTSWDSSFPTKPGVIFHPNGLVSMFSGDNLVQWDLKTLQEHYIQLQDIYSIETVSPDGATTIAYAPGGDIWGINLYDNASGQLTAYVGDSRGEEGGFVYSPDEKLLASTNYDPGNDGLAGIGYISIMTTPPNCQMVGVLAVLGYLGQVIFSPGGRIIASIDSSGALIVWRVTDSLGDTRLSHSVPLSTCGVPTAEPTATPLPIATGIVYPEPTVPPPNIGPTRDPQATPPLPTLDPYG